MSAASLAELLVEYDRARAYTHDLWSDLSEDEVRWRPHANSSAIGWHLGHQPAVAHFMVRNLTAAEASLDAELEALMDAATGEPDRGDLPTLDRIVCSRSASPEHLTPCGIPEFGPRRWPAALGGTLVSGVVGRVEPGGRRDPRVVVHGTLRAQGSCWASASATVEGSAGRRPGSGRGGGSSLAAGPISGATTRRRVEAR